MIKVLKFGGSSVSSAINLNTLKSIVASEGNKKIVVCSAIKGITDHLVVLASFVKRDNSIAVQQSLQQLQQTHFKLIDELVEERDANQNMKAEITSLIIALADITSQEYTTVTHSIIITYGETLLTTLVSSFLRLKGLNNILLDAKDFMYIDCIDVPNIKNVSTRLKNILKENTDSNVFITQGFICRTRTNVIDHLERGGSDYTATIIGAAVDAEVVEIWSDINGFQNNDPRFVAETISIPFMTYEQASDLATFGATILHPKAVLPIMHKNIPIVLKNTFNPSEAGTIISGCTKGKGLKAISSKDGITLLKLKSKGLLPAQKYLKLIFDTLDANKTSVDHMTTINGTTLIAIDDMCQLAKVIEEIEPFAQVLVEKNNSIICIVGDTVWSKEQSGKIFEVVGQIPIKSISYGINKNIAFIVETKFKVESLNFLNSNLFSID